MTIRFSILLPSILIFSLLQIGCEDDPPIPPIIEKPKAKRNFNWSIDTLEYPDSYQTTMDVIWGVNSSKLFAAGHNERGYGKMYVYDGIKWSPVDLTSLERSGGFTFSSMFGFSSSDIYAVGSEAYTTTLPPFVLFDSSLVLHYNGSSWKKINIPNRKRSLSDIHGTSPTNIVVGGYKGTLFKFNGIEWKRLIIPDSLSVVSVHCINDSLTYVGLFSNTIEGGEWWYFGYHNGQNLTILNTANLSINPITFGLNLKSIDNRIYSIGSYLFEYINESWSLIKSTSELSITNMAGTSRNNMFLVGGYDLVMHYNGEDWYEYPKFFPSSNKVIYNDVWTDSNEVFIIGVAYGEKQRTVVLHGK
jgi:hypothetical protein